MYFNCSSLHSFGFLQCFCNFSSGAISSVSSMGFAAALHFWTDPLAFFGICSCCPVHVLQAAARSSSAMPEECPHGHFAVVFLSCKVVVRGSPFPSSSSHWSSSPGWLWRCSFHSPGWSPAPGDVPYLSFDCTGCHKCCHMSLCLALSIVTAGTCTVVAISADVTVR